MTYTPILTVEEADTILAGYWQASAWAALTDEDQKAALVEQASRMIDYILAVAREDADEDALQYATAIQAAFLAANGSTIARAMREGADGIKAQSLGNMSQTKGRSNFQMRQTYHQEVFLVLREYIHTGVMMKRV